MNTDIIQDIPERQIRYFGGPGKMLLPCAATVAAALAGIPAGSLLTVKQLQQRLAARFEVRGVCPVTTRKMLREIAEAGQAGAPVWRVIKTTGDLFPFFPGGAQGQASLLRAEGFTIQPHDKGLRVKNFKTNLINL